MPIYDAKVRSIFLGVLLAAAAVLVFLIFRPYIGSLLLAFILSVIFRPLFMSILRRTGHRDTLAAVITTILIILIILVPVAIFATLVFREIGSLLAAPDSVILHPSRIHLPQVLQKANVDLKTYAQNTLNGFINDAGNIFHNVTQFFVDTVLTIISLIYLFKDGHRFRKAILNALPFTKTQGEKITEDVATGIRAVIGGYLLVAVIQGILSGLGFWIFGVPNPALWGFVTVIAALVPTFGTSLVNIPAIIYLFYTRHTGGGIGLLIWWLAAVTIIDNFVGPKFISGRVRIHVLLLIFSIIGGLKIFGTLGFLMGPLIVIFFWSILEMFQDRDTERDIAEA